MSAPQEAPKIVRSANDPRKDNMIIRYDKESIAKITGDPNAGTSEFYQLISMFIGIYAFLGKVRLASAQKDIGKMGRMGFTVLLLHFDREHAPRKQVPADIHRDRNHHRVLRVCLRSASPTHA